MYHLKSKSLVLFLLIISLLLLNGCTSNKLVITGDKASLNLEVTETEPYTITINNQRGTAQENPSFSNLAVRIDDKAGILELENINIEKTSIAGGESTQAKFNIVGKKVWSGNILFYVDSDGGPSNLLPVSISVTQPSLSISFGGFFSSNLEMAKKEPREVRLTNNDRKLYKFGKVNITSNHPNWVTIEPAEGYKAEQQGAVLELKRELDLENKIPFFITATPDANSATFTLILSVLYSHDGIRYAEISQTNKEMSVS